MLTSGLLLLEYGTDGWHANINANTEKIDNILRGPFMADHNLGEVTVTDAPDGTAESLTDNSGGTASQTISAISGSGADTDINDNFSSLTDEIEKLRADNNNLQNKINELLGKLRESGGCGILD